MDANEKPAPILSEEERIRSSLEQWSQDHGYSSFEDWRWQQWMKVFALHDAKREAVTVLPASLNTVTDVMAHLRKD